MKEDHHTLLSVNYNSGHLSFREKLPVNVSKENVRSTFCPLAAIRRAICFVSGSENGEVLVFDLSKSSKSVNDCVTKLLGHSAPVMDVSWNYDESLLASCDKRGIVILWKRKEDPRVAESMSSSKLATDRDADDEDTFSTSTGATMAKQQ